MKASLTTLVVILTIGSLGLVATSASACGGYKGGGYGYSHKSYGYGYSYRPKVYVKKVYVAPVYDQCYHPYVSTCYVLPNDTWYTLSQRVYGNSGLGQHIASYNGLGYGASMPVGQQLNLPVVNGNGTLVASNAGSAPAGFGQPAGLPGQGIAPQGQAFGAQPQLGQPQLGQPQVGQPQVGQQFGQQFGQQAQPMVPQGQPQVPQTNAPVANPTTAPNFAPNANPSEQPAMTDARVATPAANIRVASPEESFPSVAMGSILMLDGQELGDNAGIVRMRINGLALPTKVLDWNKGTVKIQLPQLDLAKAIQAEIEVMRADGSLASKSAINLTPAATRLALGN